VASLAEVVEYQSALSNLTILTLADLLAFWRSLDTEDAVGTTQAVREFLPDLMDTYVPLSAEIGAAFYDTARDQASASGSFAAAPVDEPNRERLQAMIGWGTAPLFRKKSILDPATETVIYTDEPDPDPRSALSRLSGGAQKEVADGARQTVVASVERDPARPMFARHASSNACAFCRMVASRGPVYRSAAAAGDGHKYHDHCHCAVVPVWNDEYEPAPYVAGWNAAYKDAYKAVGKADTTAILAHMRQSLGAA
jgi:hypothetical protein